MKVERRCQAWVYDTSGHSAFNHHHCDRKAIGGTRYCSIHNTACSAVAELSKQKEGKE